MTLTILYFQHRDRPTPRSGSAEVTTPAPVARDGHVSEECEISMTQPETEIYRVCAISMLHPVLQVFDMMS